MSSDANLHTDAEEVVMHLASSLIGQKYGLFEFGVSGSSADVGRIRQDVEEWLAQETS